MPHAHPLIDQVRRNCHISDAGFARNYTLCIYLLKMRELYRWEQGLPFSARLDKAELGRWLTEREALWEGLEEEPIAPLDYADARHPAFGHAVNRHLLDEGLVYSGGMGLYGKPHFVLGELLERHTHEHGEVLVVGRELARDLTAPPAMSLGDTIVLRRESLRRVIWEMVEEWQLRRQPGPMAAALADLPLEHDLDGALERLTERELASALLHEKGEQWAGRTLGPAWETLLERLLMSPYELLLRAVRDHLADCTLTLPTLLADPARRPSLHFWFANLSGVRKALCPTLQQAYAQGPTALADAVEAGARHWQALAAELLALGAQQADDEALQARLAQRCGEQWRGVAL